MCVCAYVMLYTVSPFLTNQSLKKKKKQTEVQGQTGGNCGRAVSSVIIISVIIVGGITVITHIHIPATLMQLRNIAKKVYISFISSVLK